MGLSDIRFAVNRPTYVGSDLKTIAETGDILHEQYLENREQINIINQGLNNFAVEDRNAGVLQNVKADVNSMLDEVTTSGKYHYAANAVLNAKNRITSDSLLNAAVTDKKARDTFYNGLAEESRKKDGNVNSEIINAAYLHDQVDNYSPIQIDSATGNVVNRWTPPVVPMRVDATAEIQKIVTALKPSDIEYIQKNAKGEIVKDENGNPVGVPVVFQQHPQLAGYLLQQSATGVDTDRINTAVSTYINNTPELAAYHNYLNEARIISSRLVKGKDGNMLRDENNAPILSDITPSMARNAGIPIDENGNLLDNKGEIIMQDGTNTKIPIKNAPINLFNNDYVNKAVESGRDRNEVLQTVLSDYMTNANIKGYYDFADSFGYINTDTTSVENKMYFKLLDWDREDRQQQDIYYSMQGVTPFMSKDFDMKNYYSTADTLRTELNSIPKDEANSARRANVQRQLDEVNAQVSMLGTAYLNGNGALVADEIWQDIISKANPADIEDLNKQRGQFLKFLTNDASMPDFTGTTGHKRIKDVISNTFGIKNLIMGAIPIQSGLAGISMATGYKTAPDRYSSLWQQGKRQFQKAITKEVTTRGLNVYSYKNTYLDKYGKQSKLNSELGQYTYQQGNSFEVFGLKDDKGMPVTAAQFLDENGVSEATYDIYSAPIDGSDNMYGGMAMSFIPKDPSKNTAIRDIIVVPNTLVRDQVANNIGDILLSSAATPAIVNDGLAYKTSAMYGKIRNEIRTASNLSGKLAQSGMPVIDPDRVYNYDNIQYGNNRYGLRISPVTVDASGNALDPDEYKYQFTLVGANGNTSVFQYMSSSIDDMFNQFYQSNLEASKSSK